MGLLRKEDSGLKASGQGGSMFHRPPTPSKSCEGGLVLRNGGSQMPKDETGSQKEKEEASNGCPERARVGSNPLDLRNRRKNIQTFLGETHPPEHSCNDEERSQVDTKEPPVEKERVYTPLSINLAEEQALYQSLEDEIMANIKELEEEEEEKNQRTKESQGRGLRTERALGRDTMILGWNGQRLPTPSFPFWPSDKGALDCVGGIPRSGVYLPERETRWHPAGPCYEAVLRELSVTLHREQAAKERPSPARSSSPESGRPRPKNIPEGASSHRDKPGAPQTGDGKPPCTTDEGCAGGDLPNGDATQATPSTATSSVESLSAPEKGEGSPGKPRRALKKPERVPSIYKLKLRPRCRPRRDHRPEKGPSKIPTPVAYRRVRRTASLKSPSKSKSLNNKPRERGTLNMLRAEDQPGLSFPQDEERTVTEEDAGVSDDEESWV
ncbi:hypothetical protein JRQ81_008289 [Phrynocephalus forsythii]|uniref:Uncharacterized protein n=1 Tax=Phrynocephalus forsythii TaxID=171643 RepID=A0A9Q0XC45_9SAUR|nr:hypothetical protein JRQ81_008289 [Phrynocephalus forsythii]